MESWNAAFVNHGSVTIFFLHRDLTLTLTYA